MKSALDTAIDATVAQIIAPGGPLAVGEAVVRGVTLPVFSAAPANLRDFFAYFFAVNADKEFLVYGDERLTFPQVQARSLRMAAMLQHRHGIAKGDRVAIAMRNYPEWVEAFIAITHLGGVAVPMNAWWTAEELDYGLKDSGTRLVLADEERARRVKAAGYAGCVLTVRTSAEVANELGFARSEDEMAASPDTTWFLPEISPEDDATIMYTSGSTGHPKGAVSTHRGVVSGTMNYLVMGLALLSLAQQQGIAPPAQQVMLLNVPLFHITGSVPVMLVSVAIGRKMVIMHKWDAGEALRLIEKERATYFVGVPTMSLEMMMHPGRAKYDTSSLVDIASGGAPRPPEHVERLIKELPGKNPLQGYGLTETNGVGAGNLRDNYRAKPNSTGRASPPLVEIRIVAADAADCAVALPAGEVGEVCLRSAANVRGYWMKPDATAEAFPGDGWFRSGDLGYLDEDDYLFIVDRKKDIIIRGGENISCQEVEAALYAHPAVAEACVFGLPDERLGEIVGAVVHAKDGAALEGEALIEFVKRDLASFKVPARLWFSSEQLPKLGSGKIDKVTLRKHYRGVHTG
ncbi:acyl-CoA synthetase (AMP-forming)/AMP-acid ligase II [Polymorphobacter multimanifer]|uniref:Acyl-CoA synthetase (AMP-forming)/AMP-acid ligase II n=1 Tax=Polymorphobacter multimanifer TaxID=1070431 RepID=A0A841LAU2_9SPHN|nr:class I adenylate-forming enzyme family protein [Polymorphobacter multimanifer]MBB6226935.1 acyl-CoA synthetase (AMP-forming)/AMP-acid ligase II [Polymorphobacter multimanifer]